MKKSLLLLLCLTLCLSILASCGGNADDTTAMTTTVTTTNEYYEFMSTCLDHQCTTAASVETTTEAIPPVTVPTFVSPSDEAAATRVFTAKSPDGLEITVTMHGYQSESLGKAFYAKRSEYMTVDVTLTNTSDASIYQFVPTTCVDTHAHEIECILASEGGQKLTRSTYVEECSPLIKVWELGAGESRTLTVKLAAGGPGEYKDYDLNHGIRLYDESIYTDAVCTFAGGVTFSYTLTEQGDYMRNDRTVSIPVSVEFVCDG